MTHDRPLEYLKEYLGDNWCQNEVYFPADRFKIAIYRRFQNIKRKKTTSQKELPKDDFSRFDQENPTYSDQFNTEESLTKKHLNSSFVPLKLKPDQITP